MKDKYLVTYNDNIKKFKTKSEITQHFDCPLYIVDKIIKKTEDDNGKCHMAYDELYKNVCIHILKPKLIDLK